MTPKKQSTKTEQTKYPSYIAVFGAFYFTLALVTGILSSRGIINEFGSSSSDWIVYAIITIYSITGIIMSYFTFKRRFWAYIVLLCMAVLDAMSKTLMALALGIRPPFASFIFLAFAIGGFKKMREASGKITKKSSIQGSNYIRYFCYYSYIYFILNTGISISIILFSLLRYNVLLAASNITIAATIGILGVLLTRHLRHKSRNALKGLIALGITALALTVVSFVGIIHIYFDPLMTLIHIILAIIGFKYLK
jgi:CHASE2 domain-containing sensor protein